MKAQFFFISEEWKKVQELPTNNVPYLAELDQVNNVHIETAKYPG